jgi:hypothetical protein
MDRCNNLCTKEATGTCALCEARAEADRFFRFWFQGGLFIDVVRVLKRGNMRLLDQSKAPGCWLYPVPRIEGRHKDVVREAHKQYSETLNKTMLTFISVALFILLTTLVSPDELLLATNSSIKVPLIDVPMSLFFVLMLVAPLLLIALAIYLHIFYGYWLDYERDRQYINQQSIPPIESIPTLFSFPDDLSRILTLYVFYCLVPVVLLIITWKAWAFPIAGLSLT